MTLSPSERIKGSIMGALIGDALGVGPHWYYDLEEMRRDYGPWVEDYMPPLPHRYHAVLKAGENSQTGQVFTLLLESVVECGRYDETDFSTRLDGLLATLDGTPAGGRYTDRAMRDVWHARHAGIDWKSAGSFADTAEAAIRTPILAGFFADDFDLAARNIASNVLLTHRDAFVAGQSIAFGLIVWSIMNGVSLGDVSGFISENAGKHGLALSIPLTGSVEGGGMTIGLAHGHASFFDAILQPSWVYEATRDGTARIEPAHAACRLFGLACTLGFMLPAAYYFVSRFEDDFESAVLSAINGGGSNMARAAIAGALAGAQVGLSGIPERLIEGLVEHEHLLNLANSIAVEKQS